MCASFCLKLLTFCRKTVRQSNLVLCSLLLATIGRSSCVACVCQRTVPAVVRPSSTGAEPVVPAANTDCGFEAWHGKRRQLPLRADEEGWNPLKNVLVALGESPQNPARCGQVFSRATIGPGFFGEWAPRPVHFAK